MNQKNTYGSRTHKSKFLLTPCKIGGAFPEIHFIQNFYSKNKFLNKKNLNKTSIFSSSLYKKKNLTIDKINYRSYFDSNNLKMYYLKLLNLKKDYEKKNFKNYSFSYFSRKVTNNKSQIIKVTDSKTDVLTKDYTTQRYNGTTISRFLGIDRCVFYEKKSKSIWLPKSISNWKNPRGFTIPLNLRICNKPKFGLEKTLNNKFLSAANILDLVESKHPSQ